MKSFLLISLLCLSAWKSSASEGEPLHFLAQVVREGKKIEFFQDGKRFQIPLELNESGRKVIENLSPNEDVVINGHLHYKKDIELGTFRTVFVVETVHPVTLSEIGEKAAAMVKPMTVPEKKITAAETSIMQNGTFVAASLALGAGMISVMAPPSQGNESLNQMNTGVLIGAGILMAGALIYGHYHSVKSTAE